MCVLGQEFEHFHICVGFKFFMIMNLIIFKKIIMNLISSNLMYTLIVLSITFLCHIYIRK